MLQIIRDWGLGIGDWDWGWIWDWGIGPIPKVEYLFHDSVSTFCSKLPNHQSPIPKVAFLVSTMRLINQNEFA